MRKDQFTVSLAQEIVRLHDHEGMSFRLVGETLGLPAMTATNYYHRYLHPDQYDQYKGRRKERRQERYITAIERGRTSLFTEARRARKNAASSPIERPRAPHFQLPGKYSGW